DRIIMDQYVTNSWNQEGTDYVRVEVVVTNVGSALLNDIMVDDSQLKPYQTQLWGAKQGEKGISFPSYQSSLLSGQNCTFGYIAKLSEPAQIWIRNIEII
ncbi:hypothetical protein SAMD00019534_058270, partial [Acytostelium subglobosum LB1]|uniref:hypothetical protein n=1 Tax=Acytostelium subglobosum LB1 TaxID=1410327 RepID=UPI000645103A